VRLTSEPGAVTADDLLSGQGPVKVRFAFEAFVFLSPGGRGHGFRARNRCWAQLESNSASEDTNAVQINKKLPGLSPQAKHTHRAKAALSEKLVPTFLADRG
jgi:hypothetical protein